MLRPYGGVSGWSMRVKGICARDYIKEMNVLKGMVCRGLNGGKRVLVDQLKEDKLTVCGVL